MPKSPDADDLGAIIKALMWALVAVLVLVAFIQGMMAPKPTSEQLEQRSIQREAQERLDQETDEKLRAIREAQIQVEMERQRKRRGN